MKPRRDVICFATVAALVLVAGCRSGAGREIAKGAVRGGSHGVIEDKAKTNVAKGAAHGALNSTHKVRDENKAKRP